VILESYLTDCHLRRIAKNDLRYAGTDLRDSS
jgi:hypothetical protein